MNKKLALVASFAIAAALSLQFGLSNVYAANKVDCSQVMTELQGGKKVSEVAKDMKISKSSVYRCRKAAAKEAKAAAGMASPAAMASPATAPATH
jgi:predicted transcriptional regulator